MAACNQPQPPATNSAPHPLIGRWTTDDVLVFYDATGRSLDARTFRITANDWGDVLGLAPRQVAFAADGTYWSEQRGVDGSVVERTSGRWAANEATLTLIQLVPTQAQLSYQYAVDESHLTFESQLDWDSDGAKDDYYVSRGRRVADN
jgi:hypothetical protein